MKYNKDKELIVDSLDIPRERAVELDKMLDTTAHDLSHNGTFALGDLIELAVADLDNPNELFYVGYQIGVCSQDLKQ